MTEEEWQKLRPVSARCLIDPDSGERVTEEEWQKRLCERQWRRGLACGLEGGTDMRYELCELTLWEGDRSRCRWCNGPLTARARTWCDRGSPKNPYGIKGHQLEWLKNHMWNVASRMFKLEVPACEADGCDRRSEHAHHATPIPIGTYALTDCRHHQEGLVALCTEHHGQAHRDLNRAHESRLQLSLLA